MPDVVMPRLSDSMEEGTILRWLKSDGDEVKRGDELAEIETDKATMAYEADTDGVLEIVAEEGSTLAIGELIARIGGAAAGTQAQAPAPEEASPQEKPAAQEQAPSKSEPERAGDGGHPAAEPAPPSHAAPSGNGAAAAGQQAPEQEQERTKASPLARRLARERGIDLQAVAGTGPGGRIVRADVEGAGEAQPAAEAPAKEPAAAPTPAPAPVAAAAPVSGPGEPATAKGEVTLQELSRIQQLVARRMAEAKATIPEFTLTTKIDMDRCVELRAQLKELELEAVPSFNDMVVRACALALREYPRANGSYNRDGAFELFSRINVGFAVAATDSLVVPTVFDADTKSLAVIAGETRSLAARVRSGEITPPELSGGTFTVSNLGMFGITEFTAVINPPQAAILAVGAMAPTPVVSGSEIVVRNVMTVTLTSDHRILYGADAAQFLARIKSLLEAPAAMML